MFEIDETDLDRWLPAGDRGGVESAGVRGGEPAAVAEALRKEAEAKLLNKFSLSTIQGQPSPLLKP